MRSFDRPIKFEKFNHISIIFLPQLESIKLMVQEHYDTPEFDDTLFIINTIYFFDETMKVLNDNNCRQHRRIYYNFEHANDSVPQEKDIAKFRFDSFGITEVWSFEPNVETFDTDLGIKYMPVRYTSLIGKVPQTTNKKFDLGFIGIVGSNGYSPRRNTFFNEFIVNPKYDFSISIMNGYQTLDLKEELANCRFAFDSKRNYRHNMQNQVRLFEHICMGQTVLSEKSDYNIFPGMIYEWETIDELNELIHTVEPQDFSEKYKELTYNDEAYELYRNIIINECYTKWNFSYFGKCGIERYDLINKLIKKFDYHNYLEIGVNQGENFTKINCDNKVSVDPEQYGYTTHQMTSDEYFSQLSEDTKFDIIFIDGIHLWEFCYRDINNSLKHLSPNGIILCHDMNPLYEMNNSRNRVSCQYWNGDVWKAFVKVRSERSDIYSCMIEDCDCGIGVICFGEQECISLSMPVEKLTYTDDFVKNKIYLMNPITINNFIDRNNLYEF